MIPDYNNKQRDIIFSLRYHDKIHQKGSNKNKEPANNLKNQAVIFEQHNLKTTSKNPKQQEKSLFASIMFEQKSGVCNCWVCKTIGKEAA